MPATKAKAHQQIELVPIESVTPHPENARRGDVGAIATSIAVNGWWGACVVSRRTDGDVLLVGEHRWRALKALQWEGWTDPDGTTADYSTLKNVPPAGMLPVVVMEGLDRDAERRVLLADNRANDLASYDDGVLASVLVELAADDGLLGSLFDGDDVDALVHLLEAPDLDVLLERVGQPTPRDQLRRIVLWITPEQADAVQDALVATGVPSPEADQIVVAGWLGE